MSKETLKFDQGKVQYSDIPQLALESVAKVFNYGSKKYSKFNYCHGTEWLRYYDACQRHLSSWMKGEDIDESLNHHVDHAIASLMMLRENIHLNKGTDNRNPIYKQLNKRMSDGEYQNPHEFYDHTANDIPYEWRYEFGGTFLTRSEAEKLAKDLPNDNDLGNKIRSMLTMKDKTETKQEPLEKEMD